jgi:hypothetical protein
METLQQFCLWLENTSAGTTIRDSLWLLPVTETIHIFGIIFLVGSTSILGLRLIGLAFKQDTVSMLAERFLPWTRAGFAIPVATGLLLFASEASKTYHNRAFQIKMLLIAAAGINAFVFHSVAYKSAWEHDSVAPFSARLAGAFSLLLQYGIVAAGGWIAQAGNVFGSSVFS